MSSLTTSRSRALLTCLVFVLTASACLVAAGRANAAYTSSSFALTPSTVNAAGHPKIHLQFDANAQTADQSNGDDAKTFAVDLPAGMALNPAAVATPCPDATFLADKCLATTQVGTTALKWRDPIGTTISATGKAYLVAPVAAGGNATIGLVIAPSGWRKIFVRSAVSGLGARRAGPDAAYSALIKTDFPRQAVTSIGLTRNITVSSFSVDLNAKANSSQTGAYFTLNPTRCSAAQSRGTITTYTGASNVRTASFTPTGCGSVPFVPTSSIALSSLTLGAPVGLTATFTLPTADADRQNSHVSAINIDLPSTMLFNPAALAGIPNCPQTAFDADACPISSKLGTATASVPSFPATFTGDIYLISTIGGGSGGATFGVVLRSPSGLKFSQIAQIASGDPTTLGSVRISASSLPQVSWSSVSLNLTAQLVKNPTACGPFSSTTTLTGYSGAAATRSQSLGILTCEPTPPDTTITSALPPYVGTTTPSIAFGSSTAGAGFDCQWDGGAWTPCTSPIVPPPLSQGQHTFCVRANSGVLVDPTPACLSFSVDTIAPVVVITSPPPGSVTGSTISISFTIVDASPIVSVVCKIDGAATVPCTSPWSVGGLSVGAHTITICATDAAGNTGCASLVIQPPQPFTVSIISGPSGTLASSSASFGFTTTGQGVSFQCNLDAGPYTSCVSPQQYSGLAQGSHTFCVRGVNSGGVSLNTDCRTFLVDTIPPTVVITQPVNGSTVVSPTNGVFTVTDATPVTTTCSLDVAPATACTSPISIPGLSPGPHSLTVCATDAAGNVACQVTNFTYNPIIVDYFTVIYTGPSGAVASTSATFTFGGAPPGAIYQCKLDTQPSAQCTSPITYTGLSQGQHTFSVNGISATGDSGTATRTWIVDTVPPVPTINVSANASTATATFSFNEPVTGVTCSLDGGAATACVSPLNLIGLPTGAHTLTVCGTDTAGNQGCGSAPFTAGETLVDTTITSGPTGIINTSSATFAFTSSTAGATFACNFDATGYSACVSPKTYTGLAIGAHSFCVAAATPAGGTDPTPACRNFTYQLPPPPPQPFCNVSGTTVTCTWASLQPGWAATCRLDGSAATVCTSPTVWTGIGPGSHTITICFIDSAGNVSCSTWTFTINPPPPTVTITSPTNGSTTTASTIAVSYVVLDPSGGTAQCNIPNGGSVPLQIGANTISVGCTVNGVSTAPVSVSVTRVALATFAPTFSQSFTAHAAGGLTGLSFSVGTPVGSDPISTAKLTEPPALLPNYSSVGSPPQMCPASALPILTPSSFDPTQCPDTSKVGDVVVTAPGISQPLHGTVYLIDRAPVAAFGVDFTGASNGNPAGTLLKFLIVTGLVQVDTNCDPNIDFCPTQLTFAVVGLPDIPGVQTTVNLNGAGRTLPGLPSTGPLFRFDDPSCGQVLSTTAALTSVGSTKTTLSDADETTDPCSAP
jgi:hypothetical protein